MQQLRLFTDNMYVLKKVDFENIKATFWKVTDNLYEVILEINSNKFLIHFDIAMNRIEQFEIIAVKWFVEMSMNILRTLKKIIFKLYFEF